MLNINALEQYLHCLLTSGERFADTHPLLDNTARKAFFTTLRERMERLARLLHSRGEEHQALAGVIRELHALVEDDLENDVRSTVMERLLEGEEQDAVLQDVLGLFVEDPDEVVEELVLPEEELTEAYRQLEWDFSEIRLAVIAKDKKMIEVLRQLNVNVGKGLAAQKNIYKPLKRNVKTILKAGRKKRGERSADGWERQKE